MTVQSSQTAVGTTAVALIGAGDTGHPGGQVTVRNADVTNAVHLGGPDVTTANGFTLASGGQVTLELQQGDVLYAVAAVSATCHVLRTGA